MRDSKFVINIVSIIISFFSLVMLHTYLTGNGLPFNYWVLIGMGYPLLFGIERKDIRNPLLVLCFIALIIKGSWIPLVCAGIGCLVHLYTIHRKLAVIALLLGSLLFPVLSTPLYKRFASPTSELVGRVACYEVAMRNWKNVFWGEGFGSFKELPENQPKFYNGRQTKKWLKRTHSDLLQGLFELGLFRMFPIVFLILLPLVWWKPTPIGASYLCVLLQGLIDFPFHRWHTGALGILIIYMMYVERIYEDNIIVSN